jgi:chemotaxis protein MotB
VKKYINKPPQIIIMKKQNIKVLITIAIVAIVGFSCVPARQFEDEKARREQCEKDMSEFKAGYDNIVAENEKMTAELIQLKKDVLILKHDTFVVGTSLRRMTVQYDKINKLNDELIRKNQELLAGNMAETEKILTELQLTQAELQEKEARLNTLETELNARSMELKEKELTINELQNKLNMMNQLVTELKEKVSSALVGYENKGLSIVQKNGKVYILLDESLLFASGSWQVNSKGREAIIKLGTVLEENPDISILIEGHTDDVPYGGSGHIKDNWDLSVMRATAIVKILVNNSTIDPIRLTAAGRSKYSPVDSGSTTTARRKNRRTEIILTPNLEELFKLIEESSNNEE